MTTSEPLDNRWLSRFDLVDVGVAVVVVVVGSVVVVVVVEADEMSSDCDDSSFSSSIGST